MHVVFSCFIFVFFIVLASVVFVLYAGCFKKKNRKTKMTCFIFLRVERTLVCFVIFSACGTRSGIIVLYFPRVERALALLCHIFRACNAFWGYCVIFSACVTRSGILCYINFVL